MLTHPRPKLSPDLADALNADAATDEARRKWWSRLLAAHLECVSDHRGALMQLEIEAHAGAIYSISSTGAAAVILRHALTLPAGRCTISAAAARRYISSKGWAPINATAELDTFPDVRPALDQRGAPWQDLAISGGALGMNARLLALPAVVARRLGVRGKLVIQISASGALDPVTITATLGAAKAHFVLMPTRLED